MHVLERKQAYSLKPLSKRNNPPPKKHPKIKPAIWESTKECHGVSNQWGIYISISFIYHQSSIEKPIILIMATNTPNLLFKSTILFLDLRYFSRLG